MLDGFVVLVIVLTGATAFGLWRRRVDGMMREVDNQGHNVNGRRDATTEALAQITVDDLGQDLGERATLVQFSSAFCQPCRATRHVLGEVSKMVPGVVHVEIDAYSVVSEMHAGDFKILPTDADRIERAVAAVGANVDLDRLLDGLRES